jgi:hypothetical protein
MTTTAMPTRAAALAADLCPCEPYAPSCDHCPDCGAELDGHCTWCGDCRCDGIDCRLPGADL